MRIPRFYCPDLTAGQTVIELPEQVHRHAIQVLRLNKGESIHLFNGKGLEVQACLIDIQKRLSQAEICSLIEPLSESPLKTTLLQGVSRGERMDYAIQKAVELGVNKIVPVLNERCNVQLNGDRAVKKIQHWQGVIISACEQSGRSFLPQLDSVITLEQALMQVRAGAKLLLEPQAKLSLAQVEQVDSVSLLIGSEGGFSALELDMAERAGFIGIRFGPRILRTETASTAALAVLQSLWGDL